MRRVRSLSKLLADAKRLTAERGKATQLANALKVSPSRVSEWLSGKTNPDGVAALALLDWVEEAEAKKQKSPGSATNTARAATQRRKVNREENNPPPGRRKK